MHFLAQDDEGTLTQKKRYIECNNNRGEEEEEKMIMMMSSRDDNNLY